MPTKTSTSTKKVAMRVVAGVLTVALADIVLTSFQKWMSQARQIPSVIEMIAVTASFLTTPQNLTLVIVIIILLVWSFKTPSSKTMAVLCYLPILPVNLIVSIICLAQKNNAFSLYHAKQSLTLLICTIIAAIVSIPLMYIGIGIIMYIAVVVCALVFTIMGIVNAAGGQCKPLPLIGKYADKFFGSIQKV